jgi:hypothetical protein
MVPIPAEAKVLEDERKSATMIYLPLLIQKRQFRLRGRKMTLWSMPEPLAVETYRPSISAAKGQNRVLA